jgi:hypothetical protein
MRGDSRVEGPEGGRESRGEIVFEGRASVDDRVAVVEVQGVEGDEEEVVFEGGVGGGGVVAAALEGVGVVFGNEGMPEATKGGGNFGRCREEKINLWFSKDEGLYSRPGSMTLWG